VPTVFVPYAKRTLGVRGGDAMDILIELRKMLQALASLIRAIKTK
jgi:hypothetical protein